MNIKNLARHFVLMVIGMFSLNAHAWDYVSTISAVTAYGGKVYVSMAGGGISGAGSNPCGGGYFFIIDPTTPYGRVLAAIAMTAKINKTTVYAWGDNTCSWAPYGTGTSAQSMIGLDLKG